MGTIKMKDKTAEAVSNLDAQILKNIEIECGRTDASKSEGIIPMDIDVLKYGDNTEHVEDWQRDYIKILIKEI